MSRPDPLRILRRHNHAGREVTLAEGVAVAGGAVALLALGRRRVDAVGVAGIGALGLADDVLEPFLRARGIAPSKGLRGHLGALRRGTLTTGAAKALGIPLLCLGTAAAVPGRSVAEVVLDGAIAAGAANLANLLDLRPGRALKVTTACAALLALPPGGGARDTGGRDLAVLAGALGVAALPTDLTERGMLGDTGANVLGALVGSAAARRLGPAGRLGVLGVLGALTLASERVSFSAVIDSRPLLRRLDHLGRRGPGTPTADVASSAAGAAATEEDA